MATLRTPVHLLLIDCQVYGETSYELVDQIIRTVEFTTEDKFIDLGSGLSSVPITFLCYSYSIVVLHASVCG